MPGLWTKEAWDGKIMKQIESGAQGSSETKCPYLIVKLNLGGQLDS